jgi:hypothetical protein
MDFSFLTPLPAVDFCFALLNWVVETVRNLRFVLALFLDTSMVLGDLLSDD